MILKNLEVTIISASDLVSHTKSEVYAVISRFCDKKGGRAPLIKESIKSKVAKKPEIWNESFLFSGVDINNEFIKVELGKDGSLGTVTLKFGDLKKKNRDPEENDFSLDDVESGILRIRLKFQEIPFHFITIGGVPDKGFSRWTKLKGEKTGKKKSLRFNPGYELKLIVISDSGQVFGEILDPNWRPYSKKSNSVTGKFDSEKLSWNLSIVHFVDDVYSNRQTLTGLFDQEWKNFVGYGWVDHINPCQKEFVVLDRYEVKCSFVDMRIATMIPDWEQSKLNYEKYKFPEDELLMNQKVT